MVKWGLNGGFVVSFVIFVGVVVVEVVVWVFVLTSKLSFVIIFGIVVKSQLLLLLLLRIVNWSRTV